MLISQGQRICSLEDLGIRRCLQFETAEGPAFLVHDEAGWHAYRNHCPHIGLQLNWKPNEFFDSSGQLLICAGHGALFRPDDGYCVSGPCHGQRLAAIAIAIRDDGVYLA